MDLKNQIQKREIKFRVWDDEIKKMIYPWNEKLNPHHFFEPIGETLHYLNYQNGFGTKNIMQFTGLKDKNGTEIYEGDILRFPAKDKWEETSFCAHEVFWHDNDSADGHIGFQMNRTHFHGNLCGGSIFAKFIPKWVNKMVIIGNIYENPELLE